MSESGIIQAIYDETLGSVLTSDVSATDTTINVASVAYFAPNGGEVLLDTGDDSEVWAYDSLDELGLTLTGSAPISGSYDADDTLVSVYPEATQRIAEVKLDGQQDTVRARIPYSMFDKLTQGFLAENAGETLRVLVELAAEYVVTDILGTVPDVAVNNLTVADDLTVNGELTVTSPNGSVVLEQGVSVTLEAGQGDPTTKPTVSTDHYNEPFDVVPGLGAPSTAYDSDYQVLKHSNRRGAYWDTTDNKLLYATSPQHGEPAVIRSVNMTTGVGTTVLTLSSPLSMYVSVTRLGSYYYAMFYSALDGTWYINKYNTSWVYQSQSTFVPKNASIRPIVGSDDTNLWVAETTSSSGRARFNKLDSAGATIASVLSDISEYTPSSSPIAFLPNRALDFVGGVRFACIYEDNDAIVRVLDASGVRKPMEDFVHGVVDNVFGLVWDGSNMWVMGGGQATNPGSTYSYNQRMSHIQDDLSPGSLNLWVGYTWYDSIGTTHESGLSPRKQYVVGNRERVSFTGADVPGDGDIDQPDSLRFYAGTGISDPGVGNYYLQSATNLIGESQGYIDTLARTGTTEPDNDFPSATPAEIVGDGAEGTWSLQGSGGSTGFTNIQYFTSPGTFFWYKPDHGGCSILEIHIVAGGGGGGSGRRSGSGITGGGSGGRGGGYGVVKIPLSLVPDEASIGVAEGGDGGAGRSTSGNGFDGNDGEDSTVYFGDTGLTITAKGGKGGKGGTSSAGGAVPTTASLQTSLIWPGNDPGAGGFNSVGSNALHSTLDGYMGAGSGGGGGGTGDSADANGGNGGSSGSVSGGSGGSLGTAPGDGGTFLTGWAMPGSGGGGAGTRRSSTAKAGGNGGLYGGGGGGSGGVQTIDSAPGGDGAPGCVVMVCY